MNVADNQRDSPSLAQGLELIRWSGSDPCVLISVRAIDQAERIARRIHATSPSPRGRFNVVDCASPAAALEQELFGRVDRRYTSGPCTLFLKEVGRLSAEQQRRLLRSLIEAAADSWPRRAPARVLACTSEPLLERVLNGTFNDRLFYRLNVIHLNLR